MTEGGGLRVRWVWSERRAIARLRKDYTNDVDCGEKVVGELVKDKARRRYHRDSRAEPS